MSKMHTAVFFGIVSVLTLGLGLLPVPALTQTSDSNTLLSPDTRERLEGLLIESGALDVARYKDSMRTELNLLWALGLANRNPILEAEMTDPRYGGAEQFASTGGWILAKGEAMQHYNAHELLVLTPAQQALVEEVSRNIYRPCCDNPAHFPDCNHGMAMLGLLELLVTEGKSEQELYAAALHANQIWFPDHYRIIAAYLVKEGVSWAKADPKTVLGRKYSSASGFARIQSLVQGTPTQSGQGCSV